MLCVTLSAMTTERPTLSDTFEETLSPNGIAATYARAAAGMGRCR
jgi:hypothetical protein